MRSRASFSVVAFAAALAVSAPAPAQAADDSPWPWVVGGLGLFGLGYANQAIAGSIMDGSAKSYIPIGGAMWLFSSAARADCSHATEGNCDVARVLVPALLGVDLALELGGLGSMVLGAAKAAGKARPRKAGRATWLPRVSVSSSAAFVGAIGTF
jgi:hypothetical protein